MILTNIFCVGFLVVTSCLGTALADYRIGVGRADITGPAAEVIFMGYAKITQKGCGLHLRQYARAFIIEDDNERLLFVSIDAGMVGINLKRAILKNLNARYGNVYTEENFILSGTHTHGAPGGYLMHLLFDIPVLGFVQQTFDALVSGTTEAIIQAHGSIVKGKIYTSSGELLDSNINRSPAAYLFNPESERNNYKYNVDKEMVQLKFVSSESNQPIGMISWFAVHPTSMNNTNCLVSSDNVGYASVLMEMDVNDETIPGRGSIVTAFASTNLGDVSPNTKGPHCIDTGLPCDNVTSTCNGDAKLCIAFGPGKDMYESTEIIATNLYKKAKELWKTNDHREVTGPLGAIHQFVDMPNEEAIYTFPNGTQKHVHGCSPAMGYSFAAGTTDGPGEFDFTQATTTGNPLWNAVRDFLAKPTEEDIACHHPKPILLPTGRVEFPYEWQPIIVSLQIFRIGDFIMAAVPGEFTTMSGRRLRNTVKEVAVANGAPQNTKVVIAGLSNIYSDYIATPEEYQLQRYEAASTIYGPYTLTIYLKHYQELTKALFNHEILNSGPEPLDFSDKLISFVTPVVFDLPGVNRKFGECLLQPEQIVKPGDVVITEFVAGHPRNDLMHNHTFLTVERLSDNDEWKIVATDANWETRFIWKRPTTLSARSIAEIRWEIGPQAEPGVYRIRHFGNYKYIFGGIFSYQGITNNFKVVNY